MKCLVKQSRADYSRFRADNDMLRLVSHLKKGVQESITMLACVCTAVTRNFQIRLAGKPAGISSNSGKSGALSLRSLPPKGNRSMPHNAPQGEGDELAKFFTSDVIITEMQNRISAQGSVSDMARALDDAAKRGQQLFSRQTYAITNIPGEGDWVALELDWTGITAVPIQNLPPGSEMKDRAAIFLQFRDGRIVRQHHYDCFEPW